MRTKNKNILLVILLIAVIGMAVGYAALSQQLVINGTANITTEWDVHIKSITASSNNSNTGAKDKSTPSFTATSATFDVDLAYPGSSASYIVTVENSGSINAMIDEVTGIEAANSQEPAAIQYSINAVSKDELLAGTEKEYIVTVKWNENVTQIPNTKTKTATITLNYVQAD